MKVSICKTFFVILICSLFGFTASADNLSYGLYWYGEGNTYKKHVPGQANPNFNKNNKTVILAHGWQNNGMVNGTHESFNFHRMNSEFLDLNLADEWIKKDWNIGIFYWREFADESVVTSAESKIWSPYGLFGMRMRRPDGSYDQTPAGFHRTKSISDLFYETYISAMSGYRGNNIRLAGHSLGSQLITAASEKINNAVNAGHLAQNLRPERLALLDSFYSNLPKSFMWGKTVGQRSYEILKELRDDGVIIEYYQNSAVDAIGTIMGAAFDGGSATKIKNISAYQNVRPWYLPAWDIGAKHVSSHYHYFLSFNDENTEEVTLGGWSGPWWGRYYDPFKRVETGKQALSARTSDSRVRDMMYNNYYWDQVEGRFSPNTSDDKFQRKRK